MKLEPALGFLRLRIYIRLAFRHMLRSDKGRVPVSRSARGALSELEMGYPPA
jgi:hypothetical protein